MEVVNHPWWGGKEKVGFRHTIKPYARDFFRDPDSALVQSEHRPQSNQVVGREDGRKSAERLLDQSFSRLISPFSSPGCLEIGPGVKPRLSQRIEPASFPKPMASPRRFADESS